MRKIGCLILVLSLICCACRKDPQAPINPRVDDNNDTITPTPMPGDVQSLPYYQSFANDFGTYITKDVTGDLSWMIDYNTAKMTGYASSTNNANEDWLISSPVDLTGVNDAKMTMSYIGRYFNNINEDVTIWASMDYIYGDEPYSATWTQVPATLTEGSNWSTFLTAEIALTDYVGQTVTFAVKYLSTDQKAGTLEIQSIAIEEKSATPVHEFVDLGLPSGTLWADSDVGSDAPEGNGLFFAWGETEPKSVYNWTTYQYCAGSENTITKYCNNATNGYNGYTDTLTVLKPEDDAAMVYWGHNWRMPTHAEMEELYQYTTHDWATQNGVFGRLYTGTNGNSIFLPASGWYDSQYHDYQYDVYRWSSTLGPNNSYSAWSIGYYTTNTAIGTDWRYRGFPIRPVVNQ